MVRLRSNLPLAGWASLILLLAWVMFPIPWMEKSLGQSTSQNLSPPASATRISLQGSMDEPLRLLKEARQSFQRVRDYSCLLVKRERINDQIGPDQVIQMKCRNQPFSVALTWIGPTNMVGQEAYFVLGQNDNKLRVKGAGGLGLFGYVTLGPNDGRLTSSSKHSITEAGIGNLLDRLEKGWQREQQLGLTRVNIAEYEYNNRNCWRVETIHPASARDQFLHYRNIIYFDKEHKLPIRLECYDWPKSPSDTRGPISEIVSFAHLKLNVGLTDDQFVR